jgi:hypothetical protein
MRTIALLTLIAFATPAWAQDATQAAPQDASDDPKLSPTSPLAPPAAPAGQATPAPEPPVQAPPVPAKPQAAAPSSQASTKGALPEVPDGPDEPLPDWTPPPPTPRENRRALFLQMAPEVQQAQRLRQAGLWISGFGWAAVLGGGILYGHTGSNNVVQGINAMSDMDSGISKTDQNTGIALMLSGAGVGIIGVALFTAGQWQLSAWHKKRPTDTMPSMSGF